MEWSNEVIGIDYAGESTERPMRYGDPAKANEMVQKFVSELWFRARYMAESGCLCGLKNLDAKTIDDLNARRYERRETTKGSRMIVETKDDLKKRLGRSPDYGDAFCQFAELVTRQLSDSIAIAEKKDVRLTWQHHRMRASRINSRYMDTTEA
jgi:hypothetical protein